MTTMIQTTSLRDTGVIIRRELLERASNRTISSITLGLAVACAVGGTFAGRALQSYNFEGLNTAVLLPVAMVTLLMVALVYSSSSLTTGVVEEKQSRVVEILLTKIGVASLVAGKVIGVGLFALAQLLLIGGSLIGSFSLAGGWAALGMDVPASTFAWLLVWFLVGFAIYALLNTIFASTVSRQEDLSQALMPLNIVQIALLVISMWFGLGDAVNATWFRFLSFVPLFSSYLMPVRMGAETWELASAAAIALVTVPLLFLLATRVYAATALRTGSRISLFAALTSSGGSARSADRPARSKKLQWILAVVAGVGVGIAMRVFTS